MTGDYPLKPEVPIPENFATPLSPLEPELDKGFSFQINGGVQYAGFYVRLTKTSWRICLGWLALTIFFFDIEPVLARLTSNVSEPNQDKGDKR